ncbi:MAG: amino acid ABC transporter ATP-binding protein, partial [Oscillospiraceae bacterium]|nr:amino acid ABC transporter ATP-binding protein [Oscillospiraceae bacterium]
MSDNKKLIEVQNLKKYYNGESIRALDGVSIDINKGDVMVVIGPSGSGKSTFLRSLNLLEVPTSGSIIFEGVDITQKRGPDGQKLDIDRHRQKMGMVFQHFNLFPHKTILQNMTLAPIKVKGIAPAEA